MNAAASASKFLLAFLIVGLIAIGYIGYRYWRVDVENRLQDFEITEAVSPMRCESHASGFDFASRVTEYIAYGMIRSDMSASQGGEVIRVHSLIDRNKNTYTWYDDNGGVYVRAEIAFHPLVLDTGVAGLGVTRQERKCKPWWFSSKGVFELPSSVDFVDISEEVAAQVGIR